MVSLASEGHLAKREGCRGKNLRDVTASSEIKNRVETKKTKNNHYNCPELRLVLQLCRSDRDFFNSNDGVFSAGQRKCYHNQNVSGAAPSQWLDSLQFSENYCSRHSAKVCINIRKCNSLPGGYDPVGLFLCRQKSF